MKMENLIKATEFKINKNLKIPYYYQLYENLVKSIQSNELIEGQKLESELELCEKFGVSRITVRQALKELELNGYIIRERGKGTFIKKKIETHSLQKVSSIVDELRKEGIKTKNKIVQKEVILPDIKIKNILQLKDKEKILFVKRLVLAFGKPLYLTKAYLPFAISGNISNEILIENSFTRIVTQILKLRLIHSKRILEADIPDEEVIKLLEMESDEKKVINYLQTIWTVSQNDDLKIIYFEEYFNSAHGKFVFEKDY